MANLITFSRIALIIPFVWLFFIPALWSPKAALAVFFVAAITDFLDGAVARARGEVSALGAAFDPIADKLLTTAALLLLVRNGAIAGAGVAGALIIVLREILVGGLREALAGQGKTLPVTRLAKVKTTAQLVALGLLIATMPGGVLGPSAAPLAEGLFWFAVILTFWTGAAYTSAAVRLLREPV